MPLSRNVPLMLLMLLLLLSFLTTTTSSSASSSSSMMESVVVEQPNSWTPLRVSFDTLAAATATTTTLDETNQHLIRDALVTHGTISITDWPEIAQKASQTMAATQHDCLQALQTGEPWTEDSSNTRPVVRVRRLIDGTTRRTIATSSSSSSSSSSSLMDTSSQHWPLVCQTWQSAAKIVQATTTETIQALARHVSLLETRAQVPLLTTRTTTSEMSNDDSIVYDTLEQVIAHGDYLQHFHSYQQQQQSPTRFSNNASPNINMDQNHPWTIDWHVDQGMLLAFTPGRWTTGSTSTSTNPHLFTDTAGPPPNPRPELYIQDSSGQALAVQLDPAVDDVVFMLGDGWRQVSRTSTFHAVPHALQLSFGATATETATSTTAAVAVAASARVWFGLMVLPPPNAIHPQSLLEHQNQQPVTFGEIRQRLIQGSSSSSSNNENDNLLDLACSQNTHRAREIRSFPVASSTRPRFLAATDDASICDNETQLYCWHTCQNLTVETSHHGCDETLRQLACVSNATGLIWSGTTNGAQYQPQCVDHGTLVENVTTAAAADDADSTSDTTPTSGGVVGNSGSGSAKSSSWSNSVGLVPVCMALWTAMGGWRG
jgi:hypothetical protein